MKNYNFITYYILERKLVPTSLGAIRTFPVATFRTAR